MKIYKKKGTEIEKLCVINYFSARMQNFEKIDFQFHQMYENS